jgi:transcriptional regulator with XRE-family HTH domain
MFQPEIEIEHHARLLQVRALRQSGLIYREIASALGISAARLSQLRPQVDRLAHEQALLAIADVTLETSLALLPLSRRSRSILAATDFVTVKDILRAGGKPLTPQMLPGCDPRSWREIRACLGALKARLGEGLAMAGAEIG